jgi:alpha-tubulin suppressor-like RCC1 family protein
MKTHIYLKKSLGLILIIGVIVTSTTSCLASPRIQEIPTVVQQATTAASEAENQGATEATSVPATQEPLQTSSPESSPTEASAGEPAESETSPAVKIVAIHANSSINLAIDDQGRVWQWGNYKLAPNNSPCKGGDACLLTPALVPNLTDVTAVSAGYDHRMALKNDGSLWGWGQNETYQLGLGYGDKLYYDEAVVVPGMTDVVAVSAGGNFTIALKQDGTVWTWGKDSAGQLGNGKDSYTPKYALREESPVQVVDLNQVEAVEAGWHHGIALRSDGTVWTWGFNQLGELGWGTADTEQHPVPAQVPGLSSVQVIGGGFSNSLAQTSDGSVWAWGGNLGGQLDITQMGSPKPYPNPGMIEEFKDAVQFDACGMQLVALKADGTVLILGIGDIGSQSFSPQGQTILNNIVSLSCGEDHLLALDKFGVVWAWGNNNVGQMGNGSMQTSSSPQPVIFP